MAQLCGQSQRIVQYGPYGSQLQQNYRLVLEKNESIKEVIIRHGYVVDEIGLVIEKPCGRTTTTQMSYGNGGNTSKIVLKNGEYITHISGTSGTYQHLCDPSVQDVAAVTFYFSGGNEGLFRRVVATLKIHTNLCPTGYGPYGQEKDVKSLCSFSSPNPPDGRIVGFFGRSNRYLESIGILVEKDY